MKRTFFQFLGFPIIIILLLSFNNVYGDDWIFYEKNYLGKHYYDKKSIFYPCKSKTVIRVWEKTIYDDSGRNSYIQELMDNGISKGTLLEMGFDKLVTMMTQIEFNCQEMRYGYIQSILYDKNGKTLDKRIFSPVQVNSSIDKKNMVIERLYQKVCVTQKEPLQK